MPHEVELPKWPRLMVRGRNVRPEQADLVILRTTSFPGGLTCSERKVNSLLRRTFGITTEPYSAEWLKQWERAAVDVGALDLQYIYNDQLASYSASGAHGWMSWGGQVFTSGMSLLSKHPTVGEVTDDWRNIAHAFPFLHLTAQLVAEEWNDAFDRVERYRPLVAWTVANGAVELHGDPGDPLFGPPGETEVELLDRRYAKGLPKEQNVSQRRLRAAVERCRRRAEMGQ
ncbi:hypothetical protein ACFW2V_13950 [Streptomyces sp. NPDC058947]|uniref:hypothetical protein n=1 Tax=Streptomyces sp. NPDC058947 TaxID=3346675 RepID=UPI0036D096CF